MCNIFTIHGAIGAGKSTVLKTLQEDNTIDEWADELGDEFSMLTSDAIVVSDVEIPLRGRYFNIVYNDLFGITALFPEPSDEWVEVLNKFYTTEEKNTAEIQHCILKSQRGQLEEIKAIKNVVDTIFIERTAWDAKNIFVPINADNLTLNELKEINAECDALISQLISYGNVYPFHVIATEEDIIKRVVRRGLVAKSDIEMNESSIPYLKLVRNQYMEQAENMLEIHNTKDTKALRRQMYRSLLFACGSHPLSDC